MCTAESQSILQKSLAWQKGNNGAEGESHRPSCWGGGGLRAGEPGFDWHSASALRKFNLGVLEKPLSAGRETVRDEERMWEKLISCITTDFFS